MVERRSVSVWVHTVAPWQVLLLRRPASRAAGWQPVTGRVEAFDASLEAACLREVREETGLGAPEALVDLGHESSFVGYDGVTYRQRSFAARYARAEAPVRSAEHEEARWVGVDEALALLRWDEDKAVLTALTSVAK
jgi:8-oxo-dGTP pyrophosphatase MutT (NUDIX family)